MALLLQRSVQRPPRTGGGRSQRAWFAPTNMQARPIRVGVAPSRARPLPFRRYPPHARGGRTHDQLIRRRRRLSAPPAWGWPLALHPPVASPSIRLTPVGVARCSASSASRHKKPPHPGGGHPRRRPARTDAHDPPHPVGVFRPAASCADELPTRPTPVGVARSGLRDRAEDKGPAPRPWGWLLSSGCAPGFNRTCPARAGVASSNRYQLSPVRNPPHLRGGRSAIGLARQGPALAAPCPWGSFRLPGFRAGSRGTRPTRVGVAR